MRLRLTAATSATDSGINKKNLRIGDGNINDFKQRHKNSYNENSKKWILLGMLLDTLGARLLGNLLACKGLVRGG